MLSFRYILLLRILLLFVLLLARRAIDSSSAPRSLTVLCRGRFVFCLSLLGPVLQHPRRVGERQADRRTPLTLPESGGPQQQKQRQVISTIIRREGRATPPRVSRPNPRSFCHRRLLGCSAPKRRRFRRLRRPATDPAVGGEGPIRGDGKPRHGAGEEHPGGNAAEAVRGHDDRPGEMY